MEVDDNGDGDDDEERRRDGKDVEGEEEEEEVLCKDSLPRHQKALVAQRKGQTAQSKQFPK
ncbi:hypothetical protein TWF191_006204 [Orbilia oligospora]|uniref:Uncharacterized protein n=1 Tax=Orbilia oligospora TaxID=2813651 RepID=A0A7C8QWA4_ORBOL|nr:hypothetical protein TWF191_006204 [Orbilia oligospora]